MRAVDEMRGDFDGQRGGHGRISGVDTLITRHEAKIWWDTLMPLPGGLFRIEHIEHDFS